MTYIHGSSRRSVEVECVAHPKKGLVMPSLIFHRLHIFGLFFNLTFLRSFVTLSNMLLVVFRLSISALTPAGSTICQHNYSPSANAQFLTHLFKTKVGYIWY